MCGLKQRRPHGAADDAPAGLAFAVDDLVLAKSWAGYHDIRMAVRLDHGSDHEEYEEVLEFRQGRKSALKFIVYHTEQTVFVQPLLGRRQAFASVDAALDSLTVVQPVKLTAIDAVM